MNPAILEPTANIPREHHPNDIIVESMADATVEIYANIVKQQADIQIQPHPNGNVDIPSVHASGETTLDVLGQQSSEPQITVHSHDDPDNTRAEGGVEITSDVISQQQNELHIELQPELQTEGQTNSYPHDDVESTTTNVSMDMIDLNSDIEEQHLDTAMMEQQSEVQSHPSHESEVNDRTTSAKSHHGIGEYVNHTISSSDLPWLELPELPMAEEVGGFVGDKPAKLEHILRPNKIVGPWRSKEEYLRSHYELLREDAVAPLRDAVQEFHAKPNMMEKDSIEHAGIYEQVSRIIPLARLY
jgi:hypothetical protein